LQNQKDVAAGICLKEITLKKRISSVGNIFNKKDGEPPDEEEAENW